MPSVESIGAGAIRFHATGPLFERRCVEELDATTWIETPSPGGPLAEIRRAATRLAEMRSSIAAACPEIRFPSLERLERDGVLDYVVPGSRLLHAAFLDQDASEGTFAELGAALARLHGIAAPAKLPNRPMVRPLEWLESDDAAYAALRAAACDDGELLLRAQRAEAHSGEPTLLHGRWSMGSVLLKGTDWVILSGAELWQGPAEHDVGYLLGELVEAMASGAIERRTATLRFAFSAAETFLAAYRSTRGLDGERLIDWTANRLMGHLVLNTCWRKQHQLAPADRRQWATALTVLRSALSSVEKRL